MTDTIGSKSSFVKQDRFSGFSMVNDTPKAKKAAGEDPRLAYHLNTLTSMAPVEEVEVIEEFLIPPVVEVTEVGFVGRLYKYLAWMKAKVGFAAPAIVKKQEVPEVKSVAKETKKTPKPSAKPAPFMVKLPVPAEVTAQQLEQTMATAQQLEQTMADLGFLLVSKEEVQEPGELQPKGLPVKRGRAVKTKYEFKKTPLGSKPDDNISEGRLHLEYVQLILNGKNLSEETLRLLTKMLMLVIEKNKNSEKLFFNLHEDKTKRNRVIKISKWVSDGLSGLLIGGAVAGFVATLASFGTAALVIGTVNAAATGVEGSLILLQALLQHKNRSTMAAMYGITLERHQNTKQAERIFGEFSNSLTLVRISWEELVKLLQQRRRVLKIES